MCDEYDSLQQQLANAQENLLLIQERQSEYVLSIDIPLQLKKEERALQRKIEALRDCIAAYNAPHEGLYTAKQPDQSQHHQIDPDDLFNANIQSLECVEHDFLMRQKDNSGYVDFSATSLERKLITYKEGYAETRPVVYKKLMEGTARVFRDFPCIERIRLVLPVPKEGTLFTSEIELKDYEQFLTTDFLYLRRDIKHWRIFLRDLHLDKQRREVFVQRYVVEAPLSMPDDAPRSR